MMNDWLILGALIDKLRNVSEGAEVTICHDNADNPNLPNCAILACNPATNWEQLFYRADTLEDALKKAIHAYDLWEII